MLKYRIVLERTYLNSCALSFPDKTMTYELSRLRLNPNVTLSIRIGPKDDAAPHTPAQLTNICTITIEGSFEVESPALERLDPSNQMAELDEDCVNFKGEFKPVLDASVFLLSQAISPFIFYKMASQTLNLHIGNECRTFLDRDSTDWYPGLRGDVSSRKLGVVFNNFSLLRRDYQRIPGHLRNAFHWYATAIEWKNPVDKFIAAYAGLEVVLNAEKLPESDRYRDKLSRIEQIVRSSDQDGKAELLDFLSERRGSILLPPLRLRLENLLARTNSKDKNKELRAFDTVSRIRNDLLHGRIIEIPEIPLIVFNPKPFDNPLQAVMSLLERCIFYVLTS